MRLPRFVRLMPLSCIALIAACAGRGPVAERPTVVILVRHAERAEGRDPDLSPAGRERAEALGEAAGKLDAIYTTTFVRTWRTAEPSARRSSLEPNRVPVGEPQVHARVVATDILENHLGERILVVGHSNTIPLIIQELGGTPVPAISDQEYSRLFTLTIASDGTTRLRESRYGR